ncbi:MAG: histidine phosphatase family protein [bacterium]|nr:histidine phosphatase family protein [bacterium]
MADIATQVPVHPDAVVYVFRHGHAAQSANGDTGDLERFLSEKGLAQSAQLGQTIAALGVVFDQIACSAAPRSQKTALEAAKHFTMYKTNWYDGKGRELYGPASDDDFATMWALTHEIERKFMANEIQSAMSYAAFKEADTTEFFQRFMNETRGVFRSIPDIARARRIAIFDHAVIGNAVAEALFPQHAEMLDTIELAPCDCIRLTTTSCQHIPLMT